MQLYKYDNYKEFSWHIEDSITACQELQKALFKLEFNLQRVDKELAGDMESMLKIVKFMLDMLSGVKDDTYNSTNTNK